MNNWNYLSANQPTFRVEKPVLSNQHSRRHTKCYCKQLNKNTDKIPRPRNAFIMYRQFRSKELAASNTHIMKLSKVIADEWRDLPKDEKKVWQTKAEEERLKHKMKYPNYVYFKSASSNLNNIAENICQHCQQKREAKIMHPASQVGMTPRYSAEVPMVNPQHPSPMKQVPTGMPGASVPPFVPASSSWNQLPMPLPMTSVERPQNFNAYPPRQQLPPLSLNIPTNSFYPRTAPFMPHPINMVPPQGRTLPY